MMSPPVTLANASRKVPAPLSAVFVTGIVVADKLAGSRTSDSNAKKVKTLSLMTGSPQIGWLGEYCA
jgi:hypothetical protein